MKHKRFSLDAYNLDNQVGVWDIYPSEVVAPFGPKRRERIVHLVIEQELTYRQREAISLYFGKGLTLRETGEAMGIAESTACRHIQKAEDRLRKILRFTPIVREGLR